MQTLLYFDMDLSNLSAESYTLEKRRAKMPALTIDQYITTNSYTDSLNRIHLKMTPRSQQEHDCDGQAANQGIRES